MCVGPILQHCLANDGHDINICLLTEVKCVTVSPSGSSFSPLRQENHSSNSKSYQMLLRRIPTSFISKIAKNLISVGY